MDDRIKPFEEMKSKDVLIKCLDGAHPLLSGCLRLTVGSFEQNARMLEVLSDSL